MEERLLAIEETLKERLSGAQTTHTLAERHVELKRTHRYTFSRKLRRFVEGRRVRWWPVDASTKFPSALDKEVADCQPFFTEMMKLFTSGEVQVIDDHGELENPPTSLPSEGMKIRIEKVGNVPNPDGYKLHPIGTKSPDSVFYDGCNKAGYASITIEGEVKGGGQGDFPGNEIGQLTDVMERLLRLQPFRNKLYGFLTDGRRFLFVLCTIVGGEYTFEHTEVYTGRAGWQVSVVLVNARNFMPYFDTVKMRRRCFSGSCNQAPRTSVLRKSEFLVTQRPVCWVLEHSAWWYERPKKLQANPSKRSIQRQRSPNYQTEWSAILWTGTEIAFSGQWLISSSTSTSGLQGAKDTPASSFAGSP